LLGYSYAQFIIENRCTPFSPQYSAARTESGTMKVYNEIAALMGRYPESAVISRFSELNIQILFYLQVEIIALQEDLRELERRMYDLLIPSFQQSSIFQKSV
jgi:hypothetical protein